ncbi:hypothetical protein PQX77_002367 [Marasmius sp. AFHP31]|nr:hypothetical protein PQX77_002367 [Marasmius sp. AFHP31]
MASDNLTEDLQSYLTVVNVIVLPIATFLLVFLVYGMYIIILGLCIHLLLHRKRSGSRLYLACTVSLSALGSLCVASQAYDFTRQAIIEFRAAKTQDLEPLENYLNHDKGQTISISIMSGAFTVMNALADLMLIHRCYILWGSNKVILYLLGGAAIVLNGISTATWAMACIGISSPTMAQIWDTGGHIDNINKIAIAVFNNFVSLLTGAKIWSTSRAAGHLMGMPMDTRYKPIVAAVLESGVLYPTTLIASIMIPLIVDPDSHGTRPIDLDTVAALMSGLAPTLIIVRVAYGKSANSVQQMMPVPFAAQSSQRESDLARRVLQITVDICSHRQDDDPEDREEAEPEMKDNSRIE